VLRAVEDDLARPGRDDGAERRGDRAARAEGPGHRIRPPVQSPRDQGGDEPVTRRFAA